MYILAKYHYWIDSALLDTKKGSGQQTADWAKGLRTAVSEDHRTVRHEVMIVIFEGRKKRELTDYDAWLAWRITMELSHQGSDDGNIVAPPLEPLNVITTPLSQPPLQRAPRRWQRRPKAHSMLRLLRLLNGLTSSVSSPHNTPATNHSHLGQLALTISLTCDPHSHRLLLHRGH